MRGWAFLREPFVDKRFPQAPSKKLEMILKGFLQYAAENLTCAIHLGEGPQ
jgi:hypothetical protein